MNYHINWKEWDQYFQITKKEHFHVKMRVYLNVADFIEKDIQLANEPTDLN